MKIVFEGTEQQIELLEKEFGMLVAKHKEENLPIIKKDYQVSNLWSRQDVQGDYDCSDEDALDVIEQALTNNATMEQIWYAIHFHAEEMGLEQLNNQ